MNRKIVLAIAGFVLLCGIRVDAQSYEEEALLISRTMPGGSARIQAMGGVQNALGGDLSSTYYNPAGLGMYNRSDFSFTPGYSISNTSSSYLGNSASDGKSTFIIPNLGIAFHTNKDGSKGLWGGTFAINFNRINDFNNTFSYSGTNKSNSIIDYFIQNATGDNTSQFGPSGYNYNTPTGLAYFNYLIGPATVLDPNNPADQYFTDVTGIPFQTETVKTSGSQNQWSFSYGVNLKDMFFIGGGIGLASFRYKAEKTYVETFDPATQPMTRMQLDETLSLSGSGINATLGVIVRPMDQFQIGVSAATPTSYQITDNYSASMTTAWQNFEYEPGKVLNNENAATDLVNDSYSLVNPWRFTGGMTFFIQKHGFITADAEFRNYGNTKYNSSYSGSSFQENNDNIKSLYKSVVNLRVGGEYRFNDYRFRAGYSYMPDPFQAPQNGVDRSLTSYSAGLGYRKEKFYIDMAVIFGQGSTSYRPYTVSMPSSPLVSQDMKNTSIMFTVGFPF